MVLAATPNQASSGQIRDCNGAVMSMIPLHRIFEADHRKKNTKGKSRDSRRGPKEKSFAEKNAESLDEDFNVSKLLALPCWIS